MSSMEIDFLGEGSTDDALAQKLILAVSGTPGRSRRTPLSGSGKASLDRRLKGLNAGVTHGASPILILRDLDDDATCPSKLIQEIISNPHKNLILRICVKESESWLLADADAYAQYCGIAVSSIPSETDGIANPKQTIINWGRDRRASKLHRHLDEAHRRGVPDWAILVDWNLEFIESHWNAERADKDGRSRSLCRTLNRLRTFIGHPPE